MTVPYNDPSKVFHPGTAPTATSTAPPPVETQQHIQAAPTPPSVPAAPPAVPPRQETLATSPISPAPGSTHSSQHVVGASRMSSHSERSGSVRSVGRGELYPISAFVLKQSGAYQAYVTVRWTSPDGRTGVTERLSSSIGFGHTGSRSLRDKGVPEGARVRLELDVLLGKHSAAKEEFVYDSRAPTSAFYTSRGTSLTIDKLTLVMADNDHDE